MRSRAHERGEGVTLAGSVLTLAISSWITACGDPAGPGPTGSSSAAVASATASASAAASGLVAPSPSSSASSREPLQLLRFTFTSEVKNREPVDEMKVAEAGQKAWAHVTLRNRSSESRRITVYFYVDGEQRSMVDLKVNSSWSYRTYAFNTLKDSDKDHALRVEIRDDTGTLLTEEKIPIKAKGVKVDLPKKKKEK